jgi:hypothetical protein
MSYRSLFTVSIIGVLVIAVLFCSLYLLPRLNQNYMFNYLQRALASDSPSERSEALHTLEAELLRGGTISQYEPLLALVVSFRQGCMNYSG